MTTVVMCHTSHLPLIVAACLIFSHFEHMSLSASPCHILSLIAPDCLRKSDNVSFPLVQMYVYDFSYHIYPRAASNVPLCQS